MTMIVCPRYSRLTEGQVSILSDVFPKTLRSKLIETRGLLTSSREGIIKFNNETEEVTFDLDALSKRVTPKTMDALNEVLRLGLCLRAISSTHLLIPMSDAPIMLKKDE